MKTKKAIDLCKKTGVLNIYCDKDVQWISNGAAIYSLWGLPELDEISVCLAYDIDSKKAEKMTIKRYPELPDTINLEDNTPDEVQLEEYTKFGLRYMGRDLRALISGCISVEEIWAYTNKGQKDLTEISISDLIIYDNPKELYEFHRKCEEFRCEGCEHLKYQRVNASEYDYDCEYFNHLIPITRPPQSWCYVKKEGADNG